MPQLLTQPTFSPNLGTRYFGMDAGNYGSVVHGFMEWDTPAPGYGGLAQVQFQMNPSTLAVAYYNQSNSQPVTDFIFSNAANTSPVFTYLQQSLSFALLYDRTYELWGSYGSAGLPSRVSFPDQAGSGINDPGAAGVGVDILAMQQITGMFIDEDTGKGNGTASPIGTGGILKPQNPCIIWPTWVYFGNNPDGLYYFGYISDWEVQVTQWTQYMVPMRCVINVDFTLLPTSAAQSGQPAGPGLSNWWAANPLGSSPATGPGASGPGVSTTTAGGIRG